MIDEFKVGDLVHQVRTDDFDSEGGTCEVVEVSPHPAIRRFGFGLRLRRHSDGFEFWATALAYKKGGAP